MTGKEELIAQLQRAFAEYVDALAHFRPDEMATIDLGDGWTPLTLTAHVAFWDDFQTRRMQAAKSGASAASGFPRDGLSNEERRALAAAKEWPSTLAEARAARARLVQFVASLNEDELAAKYPEGNGVLYLNGLAAHMVRHAEEHTEQLLRAAE